ncbi:MAG: type IV pilin [Methanosarcinaceae archaeon]|nr:type IV pilin [Methanosarcinaceae archaeon]
MVAAGAFGICGSKSFLAGGLDPVGACIEIELAEGGLTCIGTKSVSFDENRIILVHRGGTPLALESTSILITGYGNAYNGSVANGDQAIKGETFVTYADLTPAGKNKKYLKNNQQMLEDEVWTAGERLILNGKNSPKKGEYSSVSVKVNETEDTTDNYAFKAGSEITVTLIDRDRRVRLAKEKAIVNYPPLK